MRILTGTILLLLCLFLLAACSGQTATQTANVIPTPNLNALRTEVAATVLAQIPQLCAQTPSATAVPSSTATRTPTVAPTATNTLVTGTPGGTDLAAWISQTVQDETIFTPGQAFTMTWQIQNTGTSTWTTGYRLRFYSGETFGAPKEIPLDKVVKPGETVDITVPMKAPTKAGDYRSDWVMSNENLRNFKEPIFLKIVVQASTATMTPTVTLTVTLTPTP